jgi:hypothetical protein
VILCPADPVILWILRDRVEDGEFQGDLKPRLPGVQVTDVPLIIEKDPNSQSYSYYFVNVTLLCVKFEGVGFKSISEVHPLTDMDGE